MNGQILVLGGSSYLGRALVRRLGADRVVATYRERPLPDGLHFDALTTCLTDLRLDLAGFSHAVLLLGDANPDSCAANPERSRHLNVTRLRLLIDELCAAGVKPVFASTESVFDGRKGLYTEADQPNPIMTYGRQKLEIERCLPAEAVIVRLARLFSVVPGDGTLLNAWLRELETNRPIRCAADQVLSPLDVEDAAAAIVALIDRDCRGVFHVAGPDPWSRAAILHTLMEAYGRYTGQVIEASIDDFPTLEARPRDASLNPAKLIAATDVAPKSIPDCCRLLVSFPSPAAAGEGTPTHDRRVAV